MVPQPLEMNSAPLRACKAGRGQQADTQEKERGAGFRQPGDLVPQPIAGKPVGSRGGEGEAAERSAEVPRLCVVGGLALTPMDGQVQIPGHVNRLAEDAGSGLCVADRGRCNHGWKVRIVDQVVFVHESLQPVFNSALALIGRITGHACVGEDVGTRIEPGGHGGDVNRAHQYGTAKAGHPAPHRIEDGFHGFDGFGLLWPTFPPSHFQQPGGQTSQPIAAGYGPMLTRYA